MEMEGRECGILTVIIFFMNSKQNAVYIRYAIGIILLLVLLGGVTFLVQQRKQDAGDAPAVLTGVISAIGGDGTKVTVELTDQNTNGGWFPKTPRSVVGVITYKTRIFNRNKEIPESLDQPVSLVDLYSVPFTELKVGSRVVLVPDPESIKANAQEFELSAVTIE